MSGRTDSTGKLTTFCSGTCHLMECPLLNGKLREVTDWLAGFEELLGYVVNSVSQSLG